MEPLKKNFWRRPEGVTGMVFVSAAVIVGGFLAFKLLPVLAVIMESAFYTAVFGLGTTGLLYGVVRYRTLISFMFESVMRKLTNVFVTIDPIGIAESCVRRLKKLLSVIDDRTANVRGQIDSLKEEIEINSRQLNDNMRLVKEAGKDKAKYGLQAQIALRTSGSLKEANIDLDKLLVMLKGLYNRLLKTREVAEAMIQITQTELDIKKRKLKALRAGWSAVKAAMKIYQPDGDEKALLEASLEAMAEDIQLKTGEIEHFLEISSNAMNGVDLKNGVLEQQGWEMFEQWEKQGPDFLKIGDPLMLQNNQPLVNDQPVGTNEFSKLFNN